MIRVGLECDAGETSRCPFPRTRAPRHLAGPSGRFLAGQGAPRGRVVFVDLRAKVGAAQAVSAWTQSHDADHRDPGLPHLRQSPRGQRLHVSPAGDRLSTPQVVLRGQPCLRRSHTRETVASWQPPTRKGPVMAVREVTCELVFCCNGAACRMAFRGPVLIDRIGTGHTRGEAAS